ncbi:hypothetical protein HID58_038040, partial [Brassica napus]
QKTQRKGDMLSGFRTASHVRAVSQLIFGVSARFLPEDHFLKGRTEIKQLHILYKLLGSPDEEFWENNKLHSQTKCLDHNINMTVEFPITSADLQENILSVDPDKRGTVSYALMKPRHKSFSIRYRRYLNEFPYTDLSHTTTSASGFTLAGTKKRKDDNAASTLTYNQPAGSTKRAFLNSKFLQTPLRCFCSIAPQEIRRRYSGSIEFVVQESVFEDHQEKKIQSVSYILQII